MLRQVSRSAVSDTGYFLRLLACLGALLALRLVAVYVAKTDLVLDEAQYWTWSRELVAGALCLAEALPAKSGQVVRPDHLFEAGGSRAGEVAATALLPPRRLQGEPARGG